MRPRRLFLLGGLAAGLGGCGFTPLYAPPEPGQRDVPKELAAVRVGRTFGRVGQMLHQRLEARLAARDRSAPAALYELTVAPQMSIEVQGFRKDGSPSRFRMVMTSPWTLNTLSVPPRPVAKGTARALDDYNTIDNEFFASILSSETAQARMVEKLADDIVLRLTLAMRDLPPAERV